MHLHKNIKHLVQKYAIWNTPVVTITAAWFRVIHLLPFLLINESSSVIVIAIRLIVQHKWNSCSPLCMTVTFSCRCGLCHCGQLPLRGGRSLRVVLPEHCPALRPYLRQLVGLERHDVLPMQLWPDCPLTHGSARWDPIRNLRPQRYFSFCCLLSPPHIHPPGAVGALRTSGNTTGGGAC